MKLPVIKQIQRNCGAQQIEDTILVLEAISESAGINEIELDVIGELISNCCGALEVHQLIAEGASEKDALNGFMQKVMHSIDPAK